MNLTRNQVEFEQEFEFSYQKIQLEFALNSDTVSYSCVVEYSKVFLTEFSVLIQI